jgi:hypothetical protein
MIILMIIMINIVSGIIIDTFGSLREETKQLKDDIDNFCFVCGSDRESLDKLGVGKNGFTEHVRKDHYMWNYLYYMAYLEDKDHLELTGIESLILEKIKIEDISWFPCHRALILEKKLNKASDLDGYE